MHREDRLVRVGDSLHEGADGTTKLVGQIVADSVRHIDGGGTRVYRLLEDAAQKIDVRTAGVLRRELHIVGKIARPFDRPDRLLHHLVGRHAKLLLHVNRGGGDEGVNAPRVGLFQCLACPVDILLQGTGQAADGALPDRPGHCLDRLEISRTGDGKTRLDHIHPHFLQSLGDADLLIAVHGGTGALFSVTQGGVEDD